jgi:hypothetical protein
MDSLAAFSGRAPYSCYSAGSLNEFRENVDSGKLFRVDSRSFSHTSDFFVIPFVGILFGDHDIEGKCRPEAKLDTGVMNEELGPFILHLLLKCSHIILIEQSNKVLELFLKELSISLAHFIGSALDISDIENIAFGIIKITNNKLLTILDSGEEFGCLVDDLLVVDDDGDGADGAEQEADQDEGFECH